MATGDQTPHINVDIFEDLTGEISVAAPERVEDIGERIQAIRRERGLEIAEISKLTGFSVELLTDIESNAVHPQLGDVIKLSKAFDSAFGSLISNPGSKAYSITRKDDETFVSSSTSQDGKKQAYLYKRLAPDVKGRNMEAFVVQLDTNPQDSPSLHEGEEFIYVLNGVVSLDIGDDHFELEPGDSAYYMSTIPHLITAREGKATILATIYGR